MRWWVWLLVLCPFLGYWATGLFDLDEGFYGAVSREMLRRGDWITPYYNGAPWFEKPILVYWLAAPSIALFGEDFGPRLPSVLCALGLIWVVWSAVRRSHGEVSANLAALMLAGSLLVVGCGRQLMTDLPLTLAEIAALTSFWRSLNGAPAWRILSAFWLGVSVLAKGPVGALLFVIVAGLTYWREPEMRPRFRGYWGLGLLVFVVTVATWYLPAFLANRDDFVNEFLIRQNLERFSGGDRAHTVTGWKGLVFYAPVLILGAFPWSLFLPKAWRTQIGDPFIRYYARWFLTVVVFFTLSGAKLVHYVLPAIPALVVIVAVYWSRRPQPEHRLYRTPMIAIVAAFVLANLGFWWYYNGGHYGGKRIAPSQAELHALVRIARKSGNPIVVYQLGKRTVGRSLVGETSHPSIVFYANRKIEAADSMSDLKDQIQPYFLIAKKGGVPQDYRPKMLLNYSLAPEGMSRDYDMFFARP